MASVYTNDLRLEEIGSGEQSGTWGDTTNTNLELIAEGLSFGTEGITTNANTHTSTVADGATDPARSMFIKYTGTLDSACTITIAPNTLSRVHFIENGTSGSQNIIIKQGSGATITIPPGDTKAVYLDGAGSGAAVVDAFASLNVVDLKVQDDLTVTDDATVGGTLGVTGVLTTTATQVATGGITSGSNILSDTDSTDDLGTTGVRWANLFVDAITATDQITATGFTGTLDGILGSGAAAAATVTSLDTSGVVNLNLTTDSSSSTTGALIVDGGVGVAKKLFVGTDFDVSNNAVIDGTLTVGGALAKVAGKESIWIPSAAMYPSTTNPCSDLTQVETTALRPDMKVLDFAAAADDFAQFSIAFPKSWNEGTITFQPFWTVTGTNTGTVAWGLSGIAVSNDDSINTAFGTAAVTTALAFSGTSNDLMVSVESGAVTIAGSPAANDVCFFQVNRDVSADNQSGAARLLGIKVFFTTDAANDA